MTAGDRNILARSLLFQLLGGLGAGFYVAEFCNSQLLQDHVLHGLSPSVSAWLPTPGYVPAILGFSGLLAGASFLYACLASRKAGLSRLDVFARDAASNALLVLALADPVLSVIERGILGREETFLLSRFAYSGVFVFGLWCAAKVVQWRGMRRKGLGVGPQGGQGDESPYYERPPDSGLRLAWLACGVYVAIFGTLGVLQCRALNVAHIDSVIFERLYWNTLHGKFAVFDTDAHPFIAEHVALTMYLLLPLYALWPALETLSVFQTAGIGLGGIPAYLIAREVLQHRGAALAFAVAYLVNPALHYSNLEVRDAVFNPNSLSATLILWSFYLALRRRWWLYFLTAALAMLSREDACPSVFMMGLYLAIVRGERRNGLAGAAMGIGWLLLCLYVIGPFVRGRHGLTEQSIVFNYFSGMGNGLSGMFHYVLTEPLAALERLTTERDAQFFLDLTLPFGLLCLLAPEALAMAAPAFALSFLADERWAPNVSAQFWYHVIHIPLVYIASVMGASHLPGILKWLRSRWPARSYGFPGEDRSSAGSGARHAVWAGTLALVCSLLLAGLTSKWPLSVGFWDRSDLYRHWSLYVIPPEARHIRQVQDMIPRAEPVVTTHYLTQKFSHHPDVWRFPGKLDALNWVVVNRNDRFFRQGFDTSGDQEVIRKLLEGPDFEVVFQEEGLVVFKRRTAGESEDRRD